MDWLIAHLTGDYILQTDWMADNKKKSSWACTVHVFSYMLPFLLLGLTWWQLSLIAVQHWAQDRSTFTVWYMTNISGQRNFAENTFFLPWSLVIIDNTWHLIWIYVVIEIMGKFA